MSTSGWSWVQSLLLLSRREPPGVEQLREERRQAQRDAGAQLGSHVAAPDATSARVSRETIAVAYTGADAPHLADLSRSEPFWPGTRHPSNSLLLTLGNEVIVAALPATIPFVGPEALERQSGTPLTLRLGANESLFGASPKVLAAMRRACAESQLYGDPEGFELRQALARQHGVTAIETPRLDRGNRRSLRGDAARRSGDRCHEAED